MDERTLTALKASIEHWRRLETGQRKPEEAIGSSHCPLCYEFNSDIDEMCVGCPVFAYTGEPLCYGTPYYAASAISNQDPEGLDSPDFKFAADIERAFLESLLPKESE